MTKIRLLIALAMLLSTLAFGQDADGQFKLALPNHKGQLQWFAPGFKIVQSSAKPNGNEIGLRGQDKTGRVSFLGFLFLFSDQAPLTSGKCRDGILNPEKKSNHSLKVLSAFEDPRAGGPPIDLVSYTTQNRSGKTSYMVRGFVADNDICGDLEFYSDEPLTAEDSAIKKVFASYRLDQSYVAQFRDVFLYAQLLYDAHDYKAAGPMYEVALGKMREHPDGNAKSMMRVLTDQAGMSYGMAGEIPKAREIFEKAIVDDPDYPLYYYNLACADAEEKNLKDARTHLQKAFERKANVLSGESIPDPTKDDSFLPYRSNKDFWSFLESLKSNP